MSADWPDWAQTEPRWNGYDRDEPTIPAVVEAVEKLRPIWESFGMVAFPVADGTALVEDDHTSLDFDEEGRCPVLDRIAELEAELAAKQVAS